MPRRTGSIFGILAEAPWWMSVMFAALVFVALRFILPGIMQALFLSGLAHVCSSSAIWIALLFLAPGAMSAVRSLRK